MTNDPHCSNLTHPKGTPLERLLWVCVRHLSATQRTTRDRIMEESGCSEAEYEEGIGVLVDFGYVEVRQSDEGVQQLKIAPPYAIHFPLAYRRLYPMAECEDDWPIGDPDDIAALDYLTRDFPGESLLAFILEKFGHELSSQTCQDLLAAIHLREDALRAEQIAQQERFRNIKPTFSLKRLHPTRE